MELPFCILIDDDEATNVYHKIIIEEYKLVKGLKVFNSAIDALAWLKQLELNNFLIFLDINMPKMNGWQFLDEYETITDNKSKNVILLTSSKYKNDLEKTKKYLNILDYVVKPLEIKVLKEIHNKLQTQIY